MARSPVFRRPTQRPTRRRTYAVEVDLSVAPVSRPSSFTAGTPTVSTGVEVVSRPSSFTVGTLSVSMAFDLTNRQVRLRSRVRYELVVVKRVNQVSGPPLLLDVGEIGWTGLSWVNTVSAAQRLDASCKVSNLTEDVVQELREGGLGTELKLLRNGKPVFAGPVFGATVQGEEEGVSVQAVGLLGYLRLMWLEETKTFDQIDQHAIVVSLIDNFQSREYGNYGIVTTGVAMSGVLRDRNYVLEEGHNIGQRVEELGKVDNGFDVSVDPSSRVLRLDFPFKGVDRSTGEDGIVFDARQVTSGDIVISGAPGDVASEAYGVGTGTGAGERIYKHQQNLELRARYGRRGVFETFDGVGVQSTLDSHTQALLDARSAPLLIPGPNLRVTADADLDTYAEGDTVSYQLHSRLGIAGAFRVRRMAVTVPAEHEESVAVEFV